MFSQARVKNSVHGGEGACVAGGYVCMVGWGVCDREACMCNGGMHGRGACMAGGVHGRGCVVGGMHGMKKQQLQWAIRILLECTLVLACGHTNSVENP